MNMIELASGQIEQFLDSDEKERVLPICNSYVRRLVYKTIEVKLADRVELETRQIGSSRRLVARRAKTSDEKIQEEHNIRVEEDRVLQEAIGFAELVRYISESRKLIVGHNMILDVIHMIDKFITDLPYHYSGFKACITNLFPNILDTKYMANTPALKELVHSTVLGQMHTILTQSPFKLPKIEAEDDIFAFDSPKEHQAGYDAYITGVSFISMWNHVSKDADFDISGNYKEVFGPIMNKLCLMRLQDCPYLPLDEEDPKPARDHVFYLKFPKEWESNDISSLFAPFGNVHISWIDNVSAYIALHKRDYPIATVMNSLKPNDDDLYKIFTYAQRQVQLEKELEIFYHLQIQKRGYGHRKYGPNYEYHGHGRWRGGYHNYQQSKTYVPTRGHDHGSYRRKRDGAVKKRKTNLHELLDIDDLDNRSVSDDDDVNVDDTQAPAFSDHSEGEDVGVPCLVPSRKRTISKTFAVDNAWD